MDWLFANHGRCTAAVWGSYVWKVSTRKSWHHKKSFCNSCFYRRMWTLFLYHISCFFLQLLATSTVFVVVGRFADLFGARVALSLACSATVVFFLLLAIADYPALLFIHKLPTVFMHVLPGKHHSSTLLLTQLNILNSKPGLLFGVD